MQNEQSAIALLLFRVGPVLCCAPADPVQTIIAPPKLTRPPGSNVAQPGIFYHANRVVSVSELRHRFGVDETAWEQPGRLIITLQGEAFTAYWVDEIIEVIDTPKEGWSEPSSHLPPGVFSKTLLLNENIYLFAELANFEKLPESGYLSQYINKLADGTATAETLPQTIEDQQDVQTEPLADSATELPSATTSESISPIETKTSPVASTTNPVATSPTDDKTETPAEVDQNSPETELSATEIHPAPEPPQITPAIPPTKSDLESADASDFDTHDKWTPPVAVTKTPSVPQDRPEPEVLEQGLDADSTTMPDSAETISIPVNSKPTDPADETVKKLIIQEPMTAVVPTPADKAARLKTSLQPVPAVVPESEREPEKPPFPWKNLAAAVVLFFTVAVIGSYYLWQSSNKTASREIASPKPVTTQPNAVAENKTPPTARHEDNADTITSIDKDSQPNKDSRQQDKNDYHAEIKPDDQGVTIVIHSPENESVLKTSEQMMTAKAPTTNDSSAPTDKPKEIKNKGQQEIIHIVVTGDTLWAIAKHYVNNPYKYPRLAELSKIKNPDRIYPGNRVRILRLSNKTE